jgi:hypothetical protein
MDFPKMFRVRQKFEAPAIDDIPGKIALQVSRLGLEKRVRPGQTVAVACGSRGIANYRTIVQATVNSLRELGLEPFIVPAMGSHGAATAEGQKRVLEHYGISEERIGAPIRSSLEVAQIGETEDGIPVFLEKLASEADCVVPINRIKSHTDFEYEIESGLMKLMAIGLGKQKGAATYHQAILTYGYPRVILTVARKILENGRILCGVATVENGLAQTSQIAVVRPEELEQREKELLKEAKRLEARLPFEEADILIIDEMGKDISGTGFDTKVVGRIHMPLVTREPEAPRVKRIVVCDLSENSEGNAVGVGIADFVTRRLVDKIDFDALYMNAISGVSPEQAKIPVTLKDDREAIEVAIKSIGLIPPEKLRIIRIKSTKHLGEVDVSPAYEHELSDRDDLEIIPEAKPMAFDEQGCLEPF